MFPIHRYCDPLENKSPIHWQIIGVHLLTFYWDVLISYKISNKVPPASIQFVMVPHYLKYFKSSLHDLLRVLVKP